MRITRRDALLGATALSLVAGCQKKDEGPALAAALDLIATRILQESPETATRLAVTEERAGGRFMDKLNDASKEAKERARALARDALTSLHAIDRANLTGQDVVSYDVAVASFESQEANLGYDFGDGATSPYVVTQLYGAYTRVPDFLDNQHKVSNRDEADAFLARLTAYAGVLDAETARFSEDAAAGVMPPDFAIDKAVAQLLSAATLRPAETVFVQSLTRRLAEVAEISAADRNTLLSRADAIVREQVAPAYQRQIEALREALPRAVHDAGCWRLPGGAEAYATALKSRTTTTMTPDEIHDLGVELCASLTSQMDAILRAEGMTEGSVAQRVQALAQRPDQLYPNTDEGRAQILADLNAQTADVIARMPNFFGTLAQAQMQIRRIPPDIEAGAPGGYYQRAALDGSRPGAYYINLGNTHEWPRFKLPTLNYHEGVPGHHWQIAIQQEAGELPFIRSALLSFGAFNEGWALYAEQVADEAGVYQTNPFGKLGYLQSAAFRAARLVVDTGMHHKRWSREQAIQSMNEVTGDPIDYTTREIERYSVWPGQACSYMVGRQAFLRLRQEAETAQGAAFDIKGFHDTVLTNGSVPLSVLERIVRSWFGPAA